MSTIDYYNQNASNYVDRTINANMKEQYELFLKYLKEKGRILDFGCGSGRDSLYFKNLGYEVDAIDGSKELCKLASVYTGLDVKCMDFKDLDAVDLYDGIWACASLVHVNKRDLHDILIKMRDALKKDGAMYISLKNGVGEEITSEGRYFGYLTKDEFESISTSSNLDVVDFYSSLSVTNPNETKYWNSYILKKK